MGREGKTWGRAVWLGGRLGTEGVVLDWLFGGPVTPLNGLIEQAAECTTHISSTYPLLAT